MSRHALSERTRHWGIVQFPGSNCDHDAFKVVEALQEKDSKLKAVMHWHEDIISPGDYEFLILPGGFSYGDYLRAGAIAKLSPALSKLQECIRSGMHVLGICNGFQILIEMRLLPGYLQVNQNLRFVSKTVELEVTSEALPWFTQDDIGRKVSFPIAHRFGNFQVPQVDVDEVATALKYIKNPNGSFNSSAGIYRKLGKGTILGMMPHPERAFFEDVRLTDSHFLWNNMMRAKVA